MSFNMISLAFTLLLIQLFWAQVDSQVKNIILLAGQSNMSGRGGVEGGKWDGVVPSKCQPNPMILQLSAELDWVKAQEPLHKNIDVNQTCGVGPGMSFANSILANDSSLGLIGLVPCAIGGTKISEWAHGSFLYNQLLRRAEAAVQGGGTIRTLLWYQGESDAINKNDANLYKRRLKKFFMDFRDDLLSPGLPIIQVALASGGPYGQYVHWVRKAQLEIHLLNVRCVDAKGLQFQSDNLHLNTPSQVRLGEMLANVFLQMMSLSRPTQSSGSKSKD